MPSAACWTDNIMTEILQAVRVEVARTVPPSDRDDVAQDAFLALLRHDPNSMESPVAFARGIARRICLRFHAQRQRADNRVCLADQPDSYPAPQQPSSFAGDAYLRDYMLSRKQELPGRARSVMEVALTGAPSIHAIANALGMERSEVRRHILRIQRHFQKHPSPGTSVVGPRENFEKPETRRPGSRTSVLTN